MPQEKWQKELVQCVRSFKELENYFSFDPSSELSEMLQARRMSITPHTMGLIDFSNPRDPLLLMAVPHEKELLLSPEEVLDPIGDENKSPVPFLTHRYPDRVLIHTTFFCAQFCRFCFRRSKTGEANPGPSKKDAEKILAYLQDHPEIEEVILTGGDPLTLTDSQLNDWFSLIRSVEHVRRIRIHTRVPVNLPSRITDSFLELLNKWMEIDRPVYVVTHFNHPNEIAQENVLAIAKLVDAGVVVRNQHPLLRGVNDDPKTLEELYKRLVDIRVVPYYVHQLDLAHGTNHFRVPLKRGIEIMCALQGNVTGIALPRYMLDIPGGMGKVPISHSFADQNERGSWNVESPFGEICHYQEPDVCDG